MISLIKDRDFALSFIQGLGVMAVLFFLLIGAAQFNSPATIKNLESRLPAQEIAIEREAIKKAPPPPTTAKPKSEPKALPAKPPLVADHAKSDHPFQIYRRSFETTGHPAIAIAIKDFGLSNSAAEQILKTLPPEMSLLLSPYAKDAKIWGEKARASGHEFWLMLPIETSVSEQSFQGNKFLSGTGTLAGNQDALNWVMNSAAEYVGFAALTDAQFILAETVAKPSLRQIFSKQFGFLELNPEAPAYIETMALAENAAYAQVTAPVADDFKPEDFKAFLLKLEQKAITNGFALAVIEPYPAYIQVVADWSKTLSAKNIDLAPASAIAAATLQRAE